MPMSHRSTSVGVVTSKSSPVTTSQAWLAGVSFWCPSTWLPSSMALSERVHYRLLNGINHE
jgi:hypothetical protein